MKRILASLLPLIGACFVSLVASPVAHAADNCTISANPLTFGNYDTVNADAGTTTLTVACTHTGGGSHNFNFMLKLSRGPGASYATRSMSAVSGTDTLFYNLYTSAAYTSIWGDGSAGTVFVSGTVTVPAASSGSIDVTVYGLIAANQTVQPGNYATATPITVSLMGVPSNANSDTFYVNTFVPAQCTVSAPNMAFGNVSPTSSQTDASSTMSVSCTKSTTYTVGLDAGTTTGSTIAQRLMANGASTMDYNLYTDTARTAVWGNSTGSWVSGTGTGLATNQSLVVYGRVAAGQVDLAVGSYRENAITVTVTY